MTASTADFLRGPGLIVILVAAFALIYFIYAIRWLVPAIGAAVIGYIFVRNPPFGIALILVSAGVVGLIALARAIEAWVRGAPDYAFRKEGRRQVAVSRTDVIAEHAEWNRMSENAVALLKKIPATDGRKKKRLAQLGLKAGELREPLLGERRRLLKLGLSFLDTTEDMRFQRGLAALGPLADELWTASQDAAGYKQVVRDRLSVPDAEAACQPAQVWEFQRGDRLHIRYVTADGERSERTMLPRTLARQGRIIHLGAHCQTRDAYRDFRADRIEELTDLTTGEIVDGRKVESWLLEHVGAAS